MAERSTQKFARNKDGISQKTYPAAYPNRSAPSKPETYNDDELILTLSQSYENRRAVQAFEWESIRLGGLLSRETST
jgi:hypothetical protein